MFSIVVSTVMFGAGIVLNSTLGLMLWMWPVQVTDQSQVQTTVPVQLATGVVQAVPSNLQVGMDVQK